VWSTSRQHWAPSVPRSLSNTSLWTTDSGRGTVVTLAAYLCGGSLAPDCGSELFVCCRSDCLCRPIAAIAARLPLAALRLVFWTSFKRAFSLLDPALLHGPPRTTAAKIKHGTGADV
jgi:hypothetical protein